MKKIIFTLCSLSLGLVQGISQNIICKIGGEYESTLKHKDYGYFLANNASPVNVSLLRGKDFSIQPIDLNTLNVSPGTSHDISSLGEDVAFEKLLNLKDNLFYIYSTFNKKNKTRIVSARLIDDNNKLVTNKSVTLFESSEPKTVYLTPLTPTRYSFRQSRNKEYELVTFIYPSREGKAKLNKDLLGFNLFDENLNVKFSKEVEMPYFENLMNILDYHVDSKGNIFMLIRVYDEYHLGSAMDIMEHTRYELVKINGGSEMQKKDLGMNGKFLVNALLSDDLDGNLVITGYYSNSPNIYDGANGIFLYKFDSNETKSYTPNIKFYEFSLDVFKSYETEDAKDDLEKSNKSNVKLYLDDVFFHPNGDILIVNEQYKSEANVNNVSPGVVKNYYLDIIAFKVNKEGKLVWTKKIPKYQKGGGKSDLSYKYHYNNGNDYFIFIDNENNLDLTPDQAPKAHVCRQGGYLVAVKLDAQGKMKKIPIFDLRTEDVSVFPFDMFKVDDNILIGKCLKNKKKRIIEINFK